MREILFRGKTKQGEWVEGDLIHSEKNFNNKLSIIDWTKDPYQFEVIHETVGQFTGLTDKNGTKIFEGDIVMMNGLLSNNNVDVIVNKIDCFSPIFSSQPISTLISIGLSFEVIGNIHDNPELLQ